MVWSYVLGLVTTYPSGGGRRREKGAQRLAPSSSSRIPLPLTLHTITHTHPHTLYTPLTGFRVHQAFAASSRGVAGPQSNAKHEHDSSCMCGRVVVHFLPSSSRPMSHAFAPAAPPPCRLHCALWFTISARGDWSDDMYIGESFTCPAAYARE